MSINFTAAVVGSILNGHCSTKQRKSISAGMGKTMTEKLSGLADAYHLCFSGPASFLVFFIGFIFAFFIGFIFVLAFSGMSIRPKR